MITVGLVKELFFINVALSQPVTVAFTLDQLPKLRLSVDKGILDVYYLERHIWHETIEGPTAFFGVESCDAIARIIVALDHNDTETADKLAFFDDKSFSVDKIPTPC